MAIRILVTDGMDKEAIQVLTEKGFEIVEKYYEPEELGEALKEFDCVIIRSATKIKEPQIDAAEGGKLKLIIRAGVGVDNIAVPYAEGKGITVKNTPNSSSNAVAELAISHLFSVARFISQAGSTMREEKWEKKAYSKGFEVEGKTMGIIGYGRIGRLVGKKAQGLGMNVLAYDLYPQKDLECETMHFAEMEDLMRQADIITLCVPSGSAPFIREETLALMKDGVVIINVSRGSNVDEAALLSALSSGKVRAAGLDVWADEKNPNWELVKHPAVSGTPHIGAGTAEAQKKIGKEIIGIVTEFFS